MKALLMMLSAVVLLSSCSSGPERRVSRNPQIFDRLSQSDRDAVLAGKVREGMSKEAVFLAFGRPVEVSEGRRNGQALEKWGYTRLQPVFFNSFYSGWGGPCGSPLGWGTIGGIGTGVDYVPVQGATVEFVNGKVVGYTVPR
jgi:hypothetical protein